MKIIILKDSMYMHNPWFSHPEHPRRVIRILEGLERNGLDKYVEMITINDVKKSTDMSKITHIISKVHCSSYIEFLKKMSSKAPVELDPDTFLGRDSLELAYGFAGLVHIMSSKLSGEPLFIIGRPPGHHAGKCGKAMGAPTQGFCILNNTCIALESLRERYERIAVLDFDVHHGNGTQEIYYKDNSVLHIDIHRDPTDFYPYTGFPHQIGEGKGEGYSVNFILPPLSGDDIFKFTIDLSLNLLEEFNPKALVVSAGFDGFLNDGLSDTRFSQLSYNYLGLMLNRLKMPLIVILEGGYNDGLTKALPAFVKGLNGEGTRGDMTITTRDYRDEYMFRNKSIYNRIINMWRGK